ncbi:hypothetical protein [uncultured Megasphaera sp.]|uniref:hypothetical protein n=1 Tax=uncultured Megasphaera sp. TaxID=165188 RepID=UPI0025D3892E|nr:hypothetical protein [uncultured Megasphaera sp.]
MDDIVKTPEELGKKLKNNESVIIIEGDLRNQVLRIKAVGKISWVVAIGAIALAVAFVLNSNGEKTINHALALVPVASAIPIFGGIATTVAAISIASAAGSAFVLSKLRDYDILSDTGERIILKK